MKLLVAYDGLEHSTFALEKAAELAGAEGAEVTVLGVVTPDARGTKSGGHVGEAPHAEADLAHAQEYFRAHGIEALTQAVHGEPADEIVEAARSGGFDLVVMGSRELGPIVGRLMGSVSRQVARHAPCPVVVAAKHGATRIDPKVGAPA